MSGWLKVFGYAYDAITGMLNLRARQYEPAMMRFGQQDIVRGYMTNPQSLNRYAYCVNDPANLIDPSGMLFESIKNSWNKAKNTVSNLVNKYVVQPVQKAVNTVKKTVNTVVTGVKKAVNAVANAAQKASSWKKTQLAVAQAQREIEKLKVLGPVNIDQINAIHAKACSQLSGHELPILPPLRSTMVINEDAIRDFAGLSEADRRFVGYIMSECEGTSLETAVATLKVIQRKGVEVSGDDLVRSGLFTETNRYVESKFLWVFPIHGDAAEEAAALLELQYRLNQSDTSIAEMAVQDSIQRNADLNAFMMYTGAQASFASVQAYNTASSAIRMDGASVAVPGYESVPSDFEPFNYEGTKYEENSIHIAKLSQKQIKHILNHTLQSVQKQSQYLSDEQLAGKLNKDSFFTPQWSNEDVIRYVEEAYNTALSQGLTGRQSMVAGGEIIELYIKADGTLDTAFGIYQYTIENFR